MKIAIDAWFEEPGPAGGIAPALRSLISALGSLTDGTEEYAIVVRSDRQAEWLSPLADNQRFVMRPKSTRIRQYLPRGLKNVARRLHNRLLKPRSWPDVPLSDGFYETLGCDVVHFPSTWFILCALPSVYNPHDLQHLHYPQFFTPAELAMRETVYLAGCRIARTVIVNSQWVKDDVIQQYGVSPAKVQIIPEASPTQLTSRSSIDGAHLIRERYGLPEAFALYPGVTWPHKNHLRLLDALAYLRDRRSLIVPLVCTGSQHERFWPQIASRIAQLHLEDQVRFLGFIPQEDLRSLYHLAQCLVLPSLFEANSLPIFEAWLEGTPVACSKVTALPEQVRDAGLLFDPLDTIDIADALARVFSDDLLREELRTRGRHRLADFDWQRTARAYRAVYRRASGQRLSEEDRTLLEWNWMQNPRNA